MDNVTGQSGAVMDDYVLILEYALSLELFVSFFANLLVIAVVIKYQYLNKKSYNILILSLSISDAFMGKNWFNRLVIAGLPLEAVRKTYWV